jgi:hypothetical protein
MLSCILTTCLCHYIDRGRLAAITIWGLSASGGRYAALAALVNIPATLFGATLYEIFLTDTSRGLRSSHLTRVSLLILFLPVVTAPHLDFVMGHIQHSKERGVPLEEIYNRNPVLISDESKDMNRNEKSIVEQLDSVSAGNNSSR